MMDTRDVRAPVSRPEPGSTGQAGSTVAARHSGSQTILLVEDNQADVELARFALSKVTTGCDVRTTRDGSDALRYLRESGSDRGGPRPAFVLLDLNMPGMDGRELLRRAKEDPRLRRIPIIVLSTSQNHSDIGLCYDLGVNGYVLKPLDLEEFVEIMGVIVRFWLETARIPSG